MGLQRGRGFWLSGLLGKGLWRGVLHVICQSGSWKKAQSSGEKRVWKNMIGQRWSGGIFYNDTDSEILVAASTGRTVHQSCITFYVSGNLIYQDCADMIDGRAGGTLPIPKGESYQVYLDHGTATWWELRSD